MIGVTYFEIQHPLFLVQYYNSWFPEVVSKGISHKAAKNTKKMSTLIISTLLPLNLCGKNKNITFETV
jgi:hypothetical protein